jgi:NADH:ubiquinone oxidoreductase subunit 4 (subunit M)
LLVNTIYNFWFFNKVFFGTFLFTDSFEKKNSGLRIDKNNLIKYKKVKTLYQDITKREFITLIILVFWLIIWGIFPEKLINFCQIHLIYLNIRSLS